MMYGMVWWYGTHARNFDYSQTHRDVKQMSQSFVLLCWDIQCSGFEGIQYCHQSSLFFFQRNGRKAPLRDKETLCFQLPHTHGS
jgi:hypothetical protein